MANDSLKYRNAYEYIINEQEFKSYFPHYKNSDGSVNVKVSPERVKDYKSVSFKDKWCDFQVGLLGDDTLKYLESMSDVGYDSCRYIIYFSKIEEGVMAAEVGWYQGEIFLVHDDKIITKIYSYAYKDNCLLGNVIQYYFKFDGDEIIDKCSVLKVRD